MLSEDESDAEVMQRLAPLSRSIQDFIALQLPQSVESGRMMKHEQKCFRWSVCQVCALNCPTPSKEDAFA